MTVFCIVLMFLHLYNAANLVIVQRHEEQTKMWGSVVNGFPTLLLSTNSPVREGGSSIKTGNTNQ